jgi:hypothetical protein
LPPTLHATEHPPPARNDHASGCSSCGLARVSVPAPRGTVAEDELVDGKVAEHWFEFDQGKLFEQLGLAVVPGPRLLPRILGHQVKKLRERLPAKR